jgi:hypothetical protein
MKRLLVGALLLAPCAFAQEREEYCRYVEQQANAESILLRTPDAVMGMTQPAMGTPPQTYAGLSDSLAGVVKARKVKSVAQAQCSLYRAETDAQQRIQFALPALERDALQNRLELIERAQDEIARLMADNEKLVAAQNATVQSSYLLEAARARLESDRVNTQSSLSVLYVPPLSDTPLWELVAEKQAAEAQTQKAMASLSRQDNWDITLEVGAHHRVASLWNTAPGPYGTFVAKWNLGSRGRSEALDVAATSYQNWKTQQETEVVRNAEILRQQLASALAAQESAMTVLLAEDEDIQSNLAGLKAIDTASAIAFRNQLIADRLVLQVEVSNAHFRLDSLRECLRTNWR